MGPKFLIFCFTVFQVASSHYYTVPAFNYPTYNYSPLLAPNNYLPSIPNYPQSPVSLPPKSSNPNVGNTASPVKCFPQTAKAYFITPSEKDKTIMFNKYKDVKPKTYSCPLCNNFADIPSSSKIAPPPPKGLEGLSKTTEKDSAVTIPKKSVMKDVSPILVKKTKISDMCEKHRKAKKISFDEDLLEGFLTGLGIA